MDPRDLINKNVTISGLKKSLTEKVAGPTIMNPVGNIVNSIWLTHKQRRIAQEAAERAKTGKKQSWGSKLVDYISPG